MKPKTKEQKKVMEMYARLSGESYEKRRGKGPRRQYLTDGCWRGIYVTGYTNQIRCACCGKFMKTEDGKSNINRTCPACGNVFKEKINRGKELKLWIAFAEVHHGYQVIRTYETSRRWNKNRETISGVWEVAQNWISPEGKRTVISRLPTAFYYVSYSPWSSMEVRNVSALDVQNDYWKLAPGARTSEALKRRGVRIEEMEDTMSCIDFATGMLKKRYAESFSKLMSRQTLADYLKDDSVPEHCWKLALRYGWEVGGRYNDWKDYIRELKELGEDTHNPKILLPDDLQREHQRTTRILNRKREEERRRQQRERAMKDEEEYRNRLKEFLDMRFSGDGLAIHVIASPLEMQEEGEKMHHCVGGYYNHEDSLILSCRNSENQRIETIEVSLKDYKVVQSRGVNNIHTTRHDDIIAVMNRNMDSIRNVDRQRRRRLRRAVKAAL